MITYAIRIMAKSMKNYGVRLTFSAKTIGKKSRSEIFLLFSGDMFLSSSIAVIPKIFS